MKPLPPVIEEIFQTALADRYQNAWVFQDRNETRRRLKAVMALSVELEKIRATNRFSTLLGEGAIESVIAGDWQGIQDTIEIFEFKDEGDPPGLSALWEDFRTILATVAAAANRATPRGN